MGRRSKRIEERQQQICGKKRLRPDEGEDKEEEDDDLIILNPPSAKRAKINNTENTNNCNSNTVTLGQADDCEWIGRYGDLDKHLLTCPLQMIRCQYFSCGCPQKIRRKDMALHVKTCEYAPINCPKCIIITISRGYLQKHLLNDCSMAQIECKECGQSMMRKDMLRHKKKNAESVWSNVDIGNLDVHLFEEKMKRNIRKSVQNCI